MKKKQGRDVIAALIAALLCPLLNSIIGKRIGAMFENTFYGYLASQAFFAVTVLTAVILLRKTHIFRTKKRLLKKNWMSAGLLYMQCLLYFVLGLAYLLEPVATPVEILCFLAQMCLVGFCEETLFRGLLQGSLHEYFGEDSVWHVALACIVAAVVFGSAHLLNLLRPNTVLFSVLVQCGTAAFMGLYTGAIYFRTGKNLWYVMFLHALMDTLAFIATGRLSGQELSDSINQIGSAGAGTILVWGGLYSLATLIILRPKKVRPLLTDRVAEQ